MTKASILLTGCNGQLGRTFTDGWNESGLAAHYNLLPVSKSEFDITDSESCEEFLQARDIAVIVNAAAYTAVDAAEGEGETERVYAVNGRALEHLANWSRSSNGKIIHISTDFVFNGEAKTPYKANQDTHPLGTYGHSKLNGEKALQQLPAEHYAIVRTSWLYSPFNANFVLTMLRLMSSRDELGIVADQRGSPTSSYSLSNLLYAMLVGLDNVHSMHHWSDDGETTWFEFAQAIHDDALEAGLLHKQVKLKKLTTEEYPTAAKRPKYSVLDTTSTQKQFNITPRPWRLELRKVLEEIRNEREQSNHA